ncbi:MAG: NAD(P)H-dependent oxidoreductase [Bacteroidetes bacterium]|nr:NAD(P)H-dependent oxidoreductase [Bacteroidota bacterium]
MKLVEQLNWRYATKAFNTQKKVSERDIDYLKEAIRLSASSYGLQLYKVLLVEDKATREALRPLCWNQSQITDASHLFVFCHKVEALDQGVDEYLALQSELREVEVQKLKGYGDFIKSKLSEINDEQKSQWTSKQTYIAAANLMVACAELEIDSCPIEGFEVEKVNALLGLDKQGYSASMLIPVGYRSAEDKTQHLVKVRRSNTQLFETI